MGWARTGSEEWTHDKVCGRILEKGEATGNRKNVHGHITGGGSGTDNFYVAKDSESESPILFLFQ